MNLKRGMLVGLFIAIGLVLTPATASASFSPAQLDFPETPPGQASAVQNLTLYNPSQMLPLNVTLALTGEGAAGFQFDSSDCQFGLPPSGSCDIAVTFTPSGPGAYAADLMVVGESIRASLTGTAPPAAITPKTWDFGAAAPGEVKSKSFTIAAYGPNPFPVTAFVSTGPDGDDFAFHDPNGCIGALAPGATCDVDIDFKPRADSGGYRQATLTDEFSNLIVDVSGTVSAGPDPIPPGVQPLLKLGLKSARKVKPGKSLLVKATVTNAGTAAAGAVVLKATVPRKLVTSPARVKVVGSLAVGRSVTRRIKVKVKKAAKRGKKLTVKVTASAPGAPAVTVKRKVTIGQ